MENLNRQPFRYAFLHQLVLLGIIVNRAMSACDACPALLAKQSVTVHILLQKALLPATHVPLLQISRSGVIATSHSSMLCASSSIFFIAVLVFE